MKKGKRTYEYETPIPGTFYIFTFTSTCREPNKALHKLCKKLHKVLEEEAGQKDEEFIRSLTKSLAGLEAAHYAKLCRPRVKEDK